MERGVVVGEGWSNSGEGWGSSEGGTIVGQ